MTTTFGPYTPVRTTGDGWFFISGQVGVLAETKTAQEDVRNQTIQALSNLRTLLLANELDFKHIAKTTVFLTEMSDFEIVNEIYEQYFPEPRPARSCIAVKELPRLVPGVHLKVEIEAVAFRQPARIQELSS